MSSAYVLLVLAISGSTTTAAAGCYDNPEVFKQSEWPHCHQVSSSLCVYSGKSGDFMKLGMDVAGHSGGWSALSIAGNGGMKGARMIVVRKDTGGAWIAEDRYSQNYVTPTPFETQDVHLMFAKETNGGTSWGVLLPIDSCKPKANGFETNYPLTDDINRWMLWATGHSHTFGYHKGRGQFRVNLLSGSKLPPSTIGHETAQILMPNASVVLGEGGQHAANPYICVILDLQNLTSRNLTIKHHVSQFEPILDPNSKQYVHHMILYGCDVEHGEHHSFYHGKIIPECERMPPGCQDFKWPWALGGEALTMPSNVGFPFGEGQRWMALQMHYYNPELSPNVRDSSGIKISFAPSVREHDAGAWQLVGGVDPWNRPPLPAQTAETALNFITPKSCTEHWPVGGLNIIGAAHHAHLAGKYLNIDILRNGKYYGPLMRENGYDFSHQSLNDGSIKTLLPGDEMHMKCVYDTSSRTQETAFGDLTQTEMCYAVMIYYPRQPVSLSQYSTYQHKHDLENLDPLAEKTKTACGSPGNRAGFEDASLMTQNLCLQPIVEHFGSSSSMGITAAHACNVGIPFSDGSRRGDALNSLVPGVCPDCWRTKSCTDEIMKQVYQQALSATQCEVFDLSVYPDLSRATPIMPDQVTCCAGGCRLFKATDYTVPMCTKSGDLSSEAAAGISLAASSAAGITTTTTDEFTSGSAAAQCGSIHIVAALVLTIAMLAGPSTSDATLCKK